MNRTPTYYRYEDFDDCGYYMRYSKRIKNIYWCVYDPQNIAKAVYLAEKGKVKRGEVKRFNENLLDNMDDLWSMLKYETYEPGKYKSKTIHEPKERLIKIAPYFPDRIVHHCVINVCRDIWETVFIDNTYSCIKGKGIHKCMEDVTKDMLEDWRGTRYCLKIDIKKFYDNIDHDVLKKIIRYKIGDEQLLRLLDKLIDSTGTNKGLPIGNYTSQYFANLYLSYFDHYMKEVIGVKYYYRYMDDIVILDGSKKRLHRVLEIMALYLGAELKLEIKDNWQVFPVDSRPIDYVGYKMNHYNILLRKLILLNFYKKLNRTRDKYHIEDEDGIKHAYSSEYGWIIRCSDEHKDYLFNKIINFNQDETKIELRSA